MPSAPLPTIDQFPSYSDTVDYVENGDRQCIWYLTDPKKQRLCSWKIATEDETAALEILQSLAKPSKRALSDVLELLKSFAAHCCCKRCHQNKFNGEGLAIKLAARWLTEAYMAQGIKHGDEIIKEITTYSSIKQNTTVKFLKYPFGEKETMKELLCAKLKSKRKGLKSKTEDVELETETSGYIYMFTHAEPVFDGMVKIGYSGSSVQSRLNSWNDCGHGYPTVCDSFDKVSHPERVEQLIHFELLEYRRALQFCSFHKTPHIEWFEIDQPDASKVIQDWCRWMNLAQPYDRVSRCLKEQWQKAVDFLLEEGESITAEALLLVYDLETGSEEIKQFIDDDVLRENGRAQMRLVKIKKEEE